MRVFAWCKPDLLVGPVELIRQNGIATLALKNLHRVNAFASPQIRAVNLDNAGRTERLLRVDDRPASSHVDWDEDTAVLRRALETAVKVAKLSGQDAGQSKKQIEEAVNALTTLGIGSSTELDLYRLERAVQLLENTQLISQTASSFSDSLRDHPSVKASLDELRTTVSTEVERCVREDLERRLTTERDLLNETANAHERLKLELASTAERLLEAERQFAEFQSRLDSQVKQAEDAVNSRLLAAVHSPQQLLADVSVLRPFLQADANHISNSLDSHQKPASLNWLRKGGQNVNDKVALRRLLTSTSRSLGVELSLMIQIHSAISARLLPVTFGPVAIAAFFAYARATCGGRLHIINVSPSSIQPRDFETIPEGGILAAAEAAKDVEGISLVVLEGANRSPLEATLLPLLQLIDIGSSSLSATNGLRLAASLVAGVTTVPVTSDLWRHAVALYAEPICPTPQIISEGELSLSSELLAPGEEPTGVVDELLDIWPDCRELRTTMCRYGSALTRIYDDEPRIADSLLNGLVLPFVVTALSAEEQAEALGKVNDKDGMLGFSLRRLRRRLA